MHLLNIQHIHTVMHTHQHIHICTTYRGEYEDRCGYGKTREKKTATERNENDEGQA